LKRIRNCIHSVYCNVDVNEDINVKANITEISISSSFVIKMKDNIICRELEKNIRIKKIAFTLWITFYVQYTSVKILREKGSRYVLFYFNTPTNVKIDVMQFLFRKNWHILETNSTNGLRGSKSVSEYVSCYMGMAQVRRFEADRCIEFHKNS